MAITTALDTDRGKVRLLIGDDVEGAGVLPGGGNFTDAQIDYYLTANTSNLYATCAAICEGLSRRWAVAPQSFTADGLQVNRGDVAARWTKQAETFRTAAQGGNFAMVDLDRRDAFSVDQEQGGVELMREDDTTYSDD